MREYMEAGPTRPEQQQSHPIRLRPLRRRRATGPRPVRPGVVPVAVRPVQPGRPAGGVRVAPITGPRVLARSAVSRPAAAGARVRRVLAGVLAVLVVAAIVVGLGLLADAVADSRAGAGPAGQHTVTDGYPGPVSSERGQVRPVTSG